MNRDSELAAVLERVATATTAWTEILSRLVPTNHILDVQTVTIPPDGWVYRSYSTPAGAVEVRNLGDVEMTVVAAGPSGAVPASGVGIYVVPAGATAVVNLASRQWTLYGTAGKRASYQVSTVGGLPIRGY